MTALALVALAAAALPAVLYFRNVGLFRPPPAPDPAAPVPRVSVLIPARNEERAIGAAVESVLASRGVELECVVLDDHSDDRTAEVVRDLARKDPRVRLEAAPPLPGGWSGKQFACYTLAGRARYPILSFLDADVRLAPDGLARMAEFLRTSGAALVSGFPRQETGTVVEKLVIPLIHFLLLGFLPLSRMRKSLLPGLGAGCGQWFMTSRAAYEKVGGHAAVKASYHDGVKLPRAYRAAGLMTDFCDVTDFAVCRMYRSGRQVWNGLAKNAGEGLAAPRLILFSTALLFAGQVLPFMLCYTAFRETVPGLWNPYLRSGGDWEPLQNRRIVCVLACAAAILPRLNAAGRFRLSFFGALLHPIGVVILLAIQWYAAVRTMIGKPVGWKGRGRPNLSSGS